MVLWEGSLGCSEMDTEDEDGMRRVTVDCLGVDEGGSPGDTPEKGTCFTKGRNTCKGSI